MLAKGAARLVLADARAAVRNSASRRVIDPVICVLKLDCWRLPGDTARAHKNGNKTGANQLAHSFK